MWAPAHVEVRGAFISNPKHYQGHKGGYGAQESGSGDNEVKARAPSAE